VPLLKHYFKDNVPAHEKAALRFSKQEEEEAEQQEEQAGEEQNGEELDSLLDDVEQAEEVEETQEATV